MFGEIARKQLDTDGFCHVPDLLPQPVIERLRDFFEPLLIADTVPRKALRTAPGGKVVTNVGDLFAWGDPAPLELLALPEVMQIATAICGENVFVAQEFAVIKHRGDGNPVLWHQDMVYRRTAPCFTMGIYLDNADAGDGALRYVPGSHLRDEPICDLAALPAVEVPARAGDAIVHDMMVAHSSEPMEGNAIRRVIYLEFMSAELAIGEEIYPRDVIDNRRRLLFAARRYRRETFPAAGCFKPRQRDPSPRDRHQPLGRVLSEIAAHPRFLRSANYCFDRIAAQLD